jgi:hypothetical protein
MPLAKLIIVDRFGATVLSKTYMCNDIEAASKKFEAKYPQCWVTIAQVDTKGNTIVDGDFYSLCPLDMWKDEEKVNIGQMTFDEYRVYWYPERQKVQDALNQELSKAELEILAELEASDDQYNPFSDVYDEED